MPCSEGLFRREEMGEKMETIPGRSQCRVLFLLHSHGRGNGRGRKASIFFQLFFSLAKATWEPAQGWFKCLWCWLDSQDDPGGTELQCRGKVQLKDRTGGICITIYYTPAPREQHKHCLGEKPPRPGGTWFIDMNGNRAFNPIGCAPQSLFLGGEDHAEPWKGCHGFRRTTTTDG